MPVIPCGLRGDHFTHETDSVWPLHFKHSHWWRRRSRSKFASHYAWGTNGVMWMQDGWKVYMDSYMTSNGSWVRGQLDWFFFLNHLLEVGLKQNWGIMGLRTLTTIDLSYLVMCEEPHEHKFIEIAFGLGSSTYEFTLHWGPVTTLHDFGCVLGRLLDTFFWAPTISCSHLLAHAWSFDYASSLGTCLVHKFHWANQLGG